MQRQSALCFFIWRNATCNCRLQFRLILPAARLVPYQRQDDLTIRCRRGKLVEFVGRALRHIADARHHHRHLGANRCWWRSRPSARGRHSFELPASLGGGDHADAGQEAHPDRSMPRRKSDAVYWKPLLRAEIDSPLNSIR